MMDKLELSLTDKGVVGIVNGEEELVDLAALQTRAPDALAADMAQVAAALGKPGYEPILDPAIYKSLTLSRLENENASMPWQPGVMRIRDFGLPDFDSIQPPRRDGDTLIYDARDTYTGLPYRITLGLGAVSDAKIFPLPLTPIEGDPVPIPADITANVLGPQTPTIPDYVDIEEDDEDD